MENKNIQANLYLKQFNESNALGFNKEFIASNYDFNFDILGKAFRPTAKIYATLMSNIDSNKCIEDDCKYEYEQLKLLDKAPENALDFLSELTSQLAITEEPNFDPNNNFKYTVANSVITTKPGFSKDNGYDITMNILETGSLEIMFTGPMFEEALIINNISLSTLAKEGTSIVTSTPNIQKLMMSIMPQTGLFEGSSIQENGELSPSAVISDEFVMKNPDGSYDYEIIDIGGGKGRNILKFDTDKILKKSMPFVNAEVAGILSQEQEVVALWNVYLAMQTSVQEDDQMVQNANAANESWSYEEDLPLSQDKKVLFSRKFVEYFMNNYIKQFITDRLPTVTEDASVFDLAEAKKAKAQKFLQDNKLT
tara:strand:- start:2310 stop:3410 length:1101 start_codon:yes stop_codon:yes gene_type:complete